MRAPAILGLPTSERLKIIILNYTVRITHESPKLLDKGSHNMVRHDGTSPCPVAQILKEWIYIFKGATYRNWKISWKLQNTPKKGCKASKSSPVKMANCIVIKAEGKAQSDGKG